MTRRKVSMKGNNNPKYKHGHTCGGKDSPEFKSWSHMIYRCTNSNSKDWDRYGGRGITVCERWLEFSNFIQDMGPKPSKKHTIDRIDNDKGYSPDNCHWASSQTQARNRSNTIKIEIDGKQMCLKDWAIRYDVPYMALWELVRRLDIDVLDAVEILGGEV